MGRKKRRERERARVQRETRGQSEAERRAWAAWVCSEVLAPLPSLLSPSSLLCSPLPPLPLFSLLATLLFFLPSHDALPFYLSSAPLGAEESEQDCSAYSAASIEDPAQEGPGLGNRRGQHFSCILVRFPNGETVCCLQIANSSLAATRPTSAPDTAP
eukprot:718358-Rhodomonas_salina.9